MDDRMELTREEATVVSKYVAEFNFRITAHARMSEADIRQLFTREAENIIRILQERAPQVLRPLIDF